MTKNTYNPYEIMMDKYDKEEMLSDVREAMLYQLGVAAVLCSRKDAGVLLCACAGRDSG